MLKKYLKSFVLSEKTKNYKLWTNDRVRLYILRKRASKRTIIHLENSGDIIWEQLYLFGGKSSPRREKQFYLKPLIKKGVTTVVLLRGKPLLVKGLDENIFISAEKDHKNASVYFLNKCEFDEFIKARI